MKDLKEFFYKGPIPDIKHKCFPFSWEEHTEQMIKYAKYLLENGIIEEDSPFGALAMMNSHSVHNRNQALEYIFEEEDEKQQLKFVSKINSKLNYGFRFRNCFATSYF